MQPRAEWLSPTIYQLGRRLGQRRRPLLLPQPLPSHADLLLRRPGAGSRAAEDSVDPPWERPATNSVKQSLALPHPSSDQVLLRTPFRGATTSSSLGLPKGPAGSPVPPHTAEAAGPTAQDSPCHALCPQHATTPRAHAAAERCPVLTHCLPCHGHRCASGFLLHRPERM